MVWCPFQKKPDLQYQKSNRITHLAMTLNLFSALLETTPEFLLATLRHPQGRQLFQQRIQRVPRSIHPLWMLNTLQRISRNAKLQCNHFASRHTTRVCLQKLPLMSLVYARGSRPFRARQPRQDSEMRTPSKVKRILRGPVELKSKEIVITNFPLTSMNRSATWCTHAYGMHLLCIF